MAYEETVFRTINLPDGKDWAYYADLNVLAFGSHLDCAGKLRAFEAAQEDWRLRHLRIVESA